MVSMSPELPRQVLDSLTAHIAIVDAQGAIVFVNRAWVRFARANGDGELLNTGVGCNYFDSCRPAAEDISAAAAIAGMQAVLRGENVFFEMEYPCHAQTEMRWFVLQVTPLTVADARCLLVAHHDITNRRLAWVADPGNVEQRRQDNMGDDAELTNLARLSGAGPAAVTARSFGMMPLRESLPALFEDLVARYAAVLDQALEQRTYKVKHPISQELRVIAERLGFSRAGPRDVVDVHTVAMRAKSDRGQRIAHAYFEESRVLLLELMGYLASYYRTYAVGAKIEQGERITDPQQGARS